MNDKISDLNFKIVQSKEGALEEVPGKLIIIQKVGGNGWTNGNSCLLI